MFETSNFTPSFDNAPGLQAWGPIASRVVKLSRVYPPVATRLFFAPPSAFHCYVLAIHHWNENEDIECFASHLHETTPRDLLHEILSKPEPALFRALKKCGKQAHSPEFYLKLNSLLSEARFANELIYLREITPKIVKFFAVVKAKQLDPLVIPAHAYLEYKLSMAFALHDVLQVARQFNIMPNDAEAASLIRRSKALDELIAKWFAKCKSPHILECLPVQLKQIVTGNELNAIAHRHRNCLIQVRFKIDLASGKRVFLLYQEGAGEHAVEAVAALVAEPDRVLWLDECMLANRRSAGREVRERIVELLSRAGIQVGVRSFQQAWDAFTGRDAMPHIEDLWDMTWAEQI